MDCYSARKQSLVFFEFNGWSLLYDVFWWDCNNIEFIHENEVRFFLVENFVWVLFFVIFQSNTKLIFSGSSITIRLNQQPAVETRLHKIASTISKLQQHVMKRLVIYFLLAGLFLENTYLV